MAIDYFQPLSFQQANPLLSGIQAGQGIYQQGVMNKYLAPSLQQQLQTQTLQNAMQQIKNQYLPQTLQSDIGLTQAQTGLAGAQAKGALANAGYIGAQTNRFQQETPYDVQKAMISPYTDPMLSRGAQGQLAAQTGAVPQSLLSMLNLRKQQPMDQSQQQPDQSDQSQAPGGLTQTDSGTPISWSGMQQQPQQMGTQPQQIGMQSSQPGMTPGTAPQVFSGTPGQNWLMFGSPINPFQSAAMMQQATSGVTQWQDAQNNAAQASTAANDTDKALEQFKNAYDKATYRGPLAGKMAAPLRGSNEQLTDSAAATLQLAMVKAQGFNKFTNMESQIVGSSKPNRLMSPGAIDQLYSFLKAKNSQTEEMPQFYQASQNAGLDRQTSDALWQNYINQRPVYDFKSNSANTNFRGSFNDYLTPQAVNALKSGQPYVPIPQNFNNSVQKQNWFNGLAPQEQSNAVSQGFKPSSNNSAQMTKALGGKNYTKINGQWYEQ